MLLSLSARRAWIEICLPIELYHGRGVALRKESVDRNTITVVYNIVFVPSLSARRAWIEISPAGCWRDARRVSLSARRAWIEMLNAGSLSRDADGRSPQGERG